MWSSCTSDWESKGPTAQFVTLSDDQNEVFKYLVLQSLLLTAYFRKSNGQKIFFSFSKFDFYVWLLCVLKLFHFGEGRNIPIEALEYKNE